MPCILWLKTEGKSGITKREKYRQSDLPKNFTSDLLEGMYMNRCKKTAILVCAFLTALNVVACGQAKEDEVVYTDEFPARQLESSVQTVESTDLETKMAGFLHDIGKPFSYQDAEVRHFHGHQKVSAEMSEKILKRLGYSSEFIKNVCYLVRTHDNMIDPNNLDNSYELILKRLTIQYADAKAHAPGKVEKRLNFLDKVFKELEEKNRL